MDCYEYVIVYTFLWTGVRFGDTFSVTATILVYNSIQTYSPSHFPSCQYEAPYFSCSELHVASCAWTPLLCKEVSALPLGDNNRVCAFGVIEPELENRRNYILLGHLVVFYVAFPESEVEAFGLDYAVQRFNGSYEISYERAKVSLADWKMRCSIPTRGLGYQMMCFVHYLMPTSIGIMKNESKCIWEGWALLSIVGVLV